MYNMKTVGNRVKTKDVKILWNYVKTNENLMKSATEIEESHIERTTELYLGRWKLWISQIRHKNDEYRRSEEDYHHWWDTHQKT